MNRNLTAMSLALFAMITFGSTPSAKADDGFGAELVLAGTFQNLSTAFSSGSSSQFGFPGGGILGDFGLGAFRLQSGLLILQQKTNVTLTGLTFTDKSQTLEVPVLLRYKFFPMFSVGAGVYGSRVLGTSNSNNGSLTITGTNNFGLLGSVAAEIPVGFYDIVIDGRFEQGLTKDTFGTSTSEIQILAGLRLGIGI